MDADDRERMRNIRQRSLIDPKVLRREVVSVIGAGSIGRQLAINLVNLGITELELWDPDSVGPENCGTQGWRVQDVGRPKVEALAAELKDLSKDVTVVARQELWTAPSDPPTALFMAVDTLDSRREIWRYAALQRGLLVIDGRMSAISGFVYHAHTNDVEQLQLFEKSLSQAVQEVLPCTARGTYFCANLIASLMTAVYFLRLNRQLPKSPLFFGVQQLCDGLLWQRDDALVLTPTPQ